MLVLDPSFLQAGFAPCLTALALHTRKRTCVLAKLYTGKEAEFLSATGMSLEEHEKHISTSGWGSLCDMSLYLRSLAVQVLCVRDSDCKVGTLARKVCTMSTLFSPPAPKLCVLVVSVKSTHWDLGVVCDAKYGWKALFPIEMWQEYCQKVVNFLAQEKQRPQWVFPPRLGSLQR